MLTVHHCRCPVRLHQRVMRSRTLPCGVSNHRLAKHPLRGLLSAPFTTSTLFVHYEPQPSSYSALQSPSQSTAAKPRLATVVDFTEPQIIVVSLPIQPLSSSQYHLRRHKLLFSSLRCTIAHNRAPPVL
ncbi:putative DNA-polymerase alpha catalytic subunit [Sesbania bispinosa]|nr:putative DNA-polymerase alpha catalytic subunit [Sesbania bispinosa]